MRLKVCGMTQQAQIEQLEAMGIAFTGFIFYPKSPRYVLRHMTTLQIRNFKQINKVGVFVNNSVDEVRSMVDECRLHAVQLHGDETPKFCEKIADYISVIKVFRINQDENITYRIKDYADVCDMFLFDTDGSGYGGTGKQFNWDILKDVNVGKPYLLSGGIGPNDAAKLADFMKYPAAKALFAVDINSHFETSPGVKDMQLVQAFDDKIKYL